MASTVDVKDKSDQLLCDLDAATTEVVRLVSVHDTLGERYGFAIIRQEIAFAAWISFVDDSQRALPFSHVL